MASVISISARRMYTVSVLSTYNEQLTAFYALIAIISSHTPAGFINSFTRIRHKPRYLFCHRPLPEVSHRWQVTVRRPRARTVIRKPSCTQVQRLIGKGLFTCALSLLLIVSALEFQFLRNCEYLFIFKKCY